MTFHENILTPEDYPCDVGGPSAAGYFHPSLRYFHGIVAVGMAQVRFFIILI